MRSYSSWVLVGLALVTVVAGAVGFFLQQTASLSVAAPASVVLRGIDAVIYAIPLLVWNGFLDLSGGDGSSDWLIRLGQFSAVGFVIVASGKILSSLFQVRNGWRRRWLERSQHDLCIGSGWWGQQLITGGNGQPTIVVDLVADEATRERCDMTGAALVMCDATLAENLKGLRLDNARRVFVACGNDALNVRVAAKIIEAACSRQATFLPSIVTALENVANVPLLHAIKLNGDKKLDLRHFELRELTARMLFDTNVNEAANIRYVDRTRCPRVRAAQLILAGDGPMLEALLRQALMLCIFEDGFGFELRLVVPEPAVTAKRFADRHPCYVAVEARGAWSLVAADARWADANAQVLPAITLQELPSSGRAQIEDYEKLLQDGTVASTLIVAFEGVGQSTAVAQNISPMLHRLAKERDLDLALWVYANLSEAHLRRALSEALAHCSRDITESNLPIYVFGDYLDHLDRDIAAQEALDFFARKINGIYNGLTQKNPDEDWHNAWLTCTEQEKASSRLAGHFLQVLQRANARLKKTYPHAAVRAEILKRMEHRRWCAEYLLNGYRPLLTDVVDDDERDALINEWYADKQRKAAYKAEFQHLTLIPWDEMERVLGKDRADLEKNKDMRSMELYEVWLCQYAQKSRLAGWGSKSP